MLFLFHRFRSNHLSLAFFPFSITNTKAMVRVRLYRFWLFEATICSFLMGHLFDYVVCTLFMAGLVFYIFH